MRNYQRQKNNPYLLPHNVYMQVLYLIRDYERLKEEYNELLYDPAYKFDDRRRVIGGISRPVENKALTLANISVKTRAIENAIASIPEHYRRGVWQNIMNGQHYPEGADVRTWQTYKQRFIYYTAKNMHYI